MLAAGTIEPTMDLTTRILVVDDDPGIRELMAAFLAGHGYHTDTAADGAALRRALDGAAYDLIVLDVMMPGEDGLSILRGLAAEPGAPAVIMMSAIGAEVDRIVGLEMGADDYLAKPCSPREMLARIRAVLRRRGEVGARSPAPAAHPARPRDLTFAGWRLDPIARILTDPDGVLVNLSDGEFRLLIAFAEHPRRVLTRDQLLDWSRGHDSEHYDRAIDVQVSRLRRKLTRGDATAELIRTVRNEGYIFVPDVG